MLKVSPSSCALLLLLLAPAVTLADDDEKLEGDLAKLQGEWKAMVGPEKNIPLTLEITKTKVVARFKDGQGQERTLEGEIKIDEKAEPKTLDWINFNRPDGQEEAPNLAIYRFEGDSLEICNGGPNNPRPTSFDEGQDGPPYLLVFTKEKKDEGDDTRK